MGQEKNFRNEFGFRSDNDAYLALGQDQYYTNGLIVSFRHALRPSTRVSKTVKKIFEVEGGQLLYNPNSGESPLIGDVDRPFAAYLFGGVRMNWLKENEQIYQASLQYGTIGPNALGKEVQETLHNTVGFYKIKGWQYQLYNESGLNASFGYSRLIGRPNQRNDFSLNSYALIGSTFSGAGAGLLFRSGTINKLTNSAMSASRISNSKLDTIPPEEFFFFARPSLHYVAYNATIQGGLFRENKGPVSHDPNRFLFSQELGVMYAKKRWTLNFSITFQSKETRNQEDSHQYGSASVFYRF
nr:lipid A deacylase LpxR family protein [Pedobacter sp. SYSU D00535]